MSISVSRLIKATFRSFFNTWTLIGQALASTAKKVGVAINFVLHQAYKGVTWLQSTISYTIFIVISIGTILFALLLPLLIYFDPLNVVWSNLSEALSSGWVQFIQLTLTGLALLFSVMLAVAFYKDVRSSLRASEPVFEFPKSGFSYILSNLVGWFITVMLILYFVIFRLLLTIGWISPSLTATIAPQMGAFWEATSSGRTFVRGGNTLGISDPVFLVFPAGRYATVDSVYAVVGQIDLRIGSCSYNLVDLSRKRLLPSSVDNACMELPVSKLEYSNTFGTLTVRLMGENEQWSSHYFSFTIK